MRLDARCLLQQQRRNGQLETLRKGDAGLYEGRAFSLGLRSVKQADQSNKKGASVVIVLGAYLLENLHVSLMVCPVITFNRLSHHHA